MPNNIRIKMYTRDGCGWCKKWHDEQEQWVSPNWHLEKIQGGVSSYPQFHVFVGARTRTLVGYHTIPEIQKAIQELQYASDN